MSTQRLVIVGAGGFGREAADVIEAANIHSQPHKWDFLGVFDDSPSEQNLSRLRDRRIPYLGVIPKKWNGSEMAFVVGIGRPSTRQMIADRLEAMGWTPATLVHPSTTIGSRVQLGPGSVVCGGVQISTNVRLGKHVHINPNATIGHDAILEDYVSVNPAAIVSGEVRVRTRTLLGAGSVILQGVTVGCDSVVGAAACVVSNVPAVMTVKGVPAR